MFSSTPLAILQPRTAIAWQFEPKTVLRAGFGIFSDILPGTIADVVGFNPPYVKTFQGGLYGTVGGTAIAPGVPNSAVDATVAANQAFSSGFTQGQLSCASAQANPATCLPPVAITAVPDGKLHAPYFMEWSLGLEHELGNNGKPQGAIRRYARGQPALFDAGERLSNRLPGMLCAISLCESGRSTTNWVVDPRFGAVTQFSTGANSHYDGLQLTAMKRLGHGLMGQINYTWSRCMDTVSNGGFLQFSAGGILSPLPGELARNYGPCDYDIRDNLNAQYVYQLPLKIQNHSLGFALNGWQVSGTVFWHSGLPFSVLSTPYSANGNGIVNGSGPQFASVVPGVPLYDTQFHSRRHTTGHGSVAESQCICVDRGPEHGRLQRWRHAGELPIWNPRPQRFARPAILLERFLPHEVVPRDRASEAAVRRSIFQCLQPSEFCASEHGAGRHSGKAVHSAGVRSNHIHHLSADRIARRWFGRR